MHKIDADLPTHQGVLEFKNGKAMVISRDKLASHAKGLREAAKLISTSTDRGKMVQTWLNEMADKFGAMEEGPELERVESVDGSHP
jgi:hypothetical protein